ncbi:sigma-70 family RNA polymerase sigma factor [Ornithinibacillus halotolerans]|uniref:sigma-70 family RNA polymerase sigma factor n=1 Tax=Ornithinibacillus halotolerans TaxID=1274357 RepID=UPI00166D992E|nr:sigma-70 family RNA polymerase sigma factor [Ornithinibacillus halotolerans]
MDLAVIKQAIKGDDAAFLQVMKAYNLDLYKTALAYLKNEHDSLEAIQEVTFRAYKKIHTLREPSYIKTWLIRIMINYCNDQLKRKTRFIVNDEQILSLGSEDNHTVLEIQDAMQQLDNRSREVLTLMYFHGLKIKEIALVMERPEGTVKTWLNKALIKFRNILEEEGGELDVQ